MSGSDNKSANQTTHWSFKIQQCSPDKKNKIINACNPTGTFKYLLIRPKHPQSDTFCLEGYFILHTKDRESGVKRKFDSLEVEAVLTNNSGAKATKTEKINLFKRQDDNFQEIDWQQRQNVLSSCVHFKASIDIECAFESNIQQGLQELVKVIEGKSIEKEIKACSGRESNKSVTRINNAYEVFLTRNERETPIYKKLQKGSSNKISSPTLSKAIKDQIVEEDAKFKDWNIANLSIIVRYEDQQAQPVHVDNGYLQEQYEYSGILMLSKNQPGTLVYNLNDGIAINHLKEQAGWSFCNPMLLGRIQQSQLFKRYGSLFFATPTKRPKVKCVNQFNLVLLKGGTPHCAPPSCGVRVVLFFTIQHPHLDASSKYTGDTQMTREKACLMLYQELKNDISPQDQTFLLDRFAHSVCESSEFGTKDETLNLDHDGDSKALLEAYQGQIKQRIRVQKAIEVMKRWEKVKREQLINSILRSNINEDVNGMYESISQAMETAEGIMAVMDIDHDDE